MKSILHISLISLLLLGLCNLKEDKYEKLKIINVKDLGFSFKIPSNCYVDSFGGPGAVYVSIRSGLDFFGAIQRNSKYFTKEVFLEKAKTFEYLESEVKISINQDTSSISIIKTNRRGKYYYKEYYFKYVDTRFYNFMIWAKDTVLLKTFVETFNTDDKKLNLDYSNRIDYEIKGSDTINFLNGATILKRNEDNFFSLNYHDDKMIELLTNISSGANCTTFKRASNFYNIRVIDKTKDYAEITVLAQYKDWIFRKVCKRKYRIVN